MKFKSDEIKGLINEDFEYENNDIEIIEEGEWVDNGKYSYKKYVFKYQNKYYMIKDLRSGSYYSNYHYEHDNWGEYIECDEVEKKEKITHEWVKVK